MVSTTIDKFCYISCRYLPPFFDIKHRIVWSHIETVSTISEILHPAVREGLRFLGFDDSSGFEIHHQGDLPARSGIGSSSSFSVGLIHALTALRGETIDTESLAALAIELEQEVLRENVGSQDQVAAAYGGLNVVRFSPEGSIAVEPVGLPPDRSEQLQSRLLLLYTGTSRLGSEVAAAMESNIRRKRAVMTEMMSLADRALELMRSDEDLDGFGHLLDEAWTLKRQLQGDAIGSTIDDIYAVARRAGALGGKLLGAGKGGFMVFYVPEGRREDVMGALSRYLWVPFAFEADGSTIIYDELGSDVPSLRPLSELEPR